MPIEVIVVCTIFIAPIVTESLPDFLFVALVKFSFWLSIVNDVRDLLGVSKESYRSWIHLLER